MGSMPLCHVTRLEVDWVYVTRFNRVVGGSHEAPRLNEYSNEFLVSHAAIRGRGVHCIVHQTFLEVLSVAWYLLF